MSTALTRDHTLPRRDWLIGIGSNLDPQRWVPLALSTLRGSGLGTVHASAPAWSPAWERQPLLPPYLNVLILLTGSTTPAWRLRRLLAGLETGSGRSAAQKARGLISLDLDLLGRRRDGQWKFWPRRRAELGKPYWQTHLAQLGLDPLGRA